LKHNQK